ASQIGDSQMLRLLLEKGAEINAQAGRYGTALIAASFCGYRELVLVLLEKGAEINAQAGEFGTALIAASSHGH
ncbi:hypothetical protein DENSPDRAFT_748797, partial [Dentipellis sp. KUC8613]